MRQETVDRLWALTESLNILYRKNWTRVAERELERFSEHLLSTARQQDQTAASRDAKVAQPHRWSFAGSFLYSLTVITTIGQYYSSPFLTLLHPSSSFTFLHPSSSFTLLHFSLFFTLYPFSPFPLFHPSLFFTIPPPSPFSPFSQTPHLSRSRYTFLPRSAQHYKSEPLFPFFHSNFLYSIFHTNRGSLTFKHKIYQQLHTEGGKWILLNSFFRLIIFVF